NPVHFHQQLATVSELNLLHAVLTASLARPSFRAQRPEDFLFPEIVLNLRGRDAKSRNLSSIWQTQGYATPDALSKPRRARDPQSDSCVHCGGPIVRHDTPAARQRFRLPCRERLPNVKHSKKYKTQQ